MSNPPFTIANFTPADSSPPDAGNQSDQDKHGPLEVLKRKRERDKQSQRRKRQRERDYTASLLERIKHLEKRLEDVSPRSTDCFNAQATVEHSDAADLDRHERDTLEKRVDHLHQVVKDLVDIFQGRSSKDVDRIQNLPNTVTYPQSLPTPSSGSELCHANPEGQGFDPRQVGPSLPRRPSTFVRSTISSLPPDTTISANELNRLLVIPEWLRIPFFSTTPLVGPEMLSRGQRLESFIQELRTSRVQDIPLICPPTPKPVDLLYGGSRNLLANFVSVEIRHEPFLPPERFAASWLLYLYFRVRSPAHRDHFLRPPEGSLITSLILSSGSSGRHEKTTFSYLSISDLPPSSLSESIRK